MRARSSLDPPSFTWRLLRTVWLVARLRCPACGLGRLSSGPFRINARCGVCDVAFEREPGEFTGGMGLNSVATCSGIALLSLWIGHSDVPLGVGVFVVALFAIVFPILFYRHSRAFWVGLLHLTGLVHRDEAADPEPEIRPWPPGDGGGGAPPSHPESPTAPQVVAAGAGHPPQRTR